MNEQKRNYTKREDDFLMRNKDRIPAKRMSKMLGRSESSARQRMVRIGAIPSPEAVEIFKRGSQFGKGHAPANKGKCWKEFMSRRGMQNARKTQFKKGNLPPNTKNNMCITIRTDKTKKDYKFIRLALGKWVPLHRYNWQQANGKIPRKMNLVFKDGDTINCDVSNLELLTNAQLMKRNTLHNYPKDIATTIQLRGALNRQINKHLKKINNEK
jgi:hypothetical protein